MRLSMSRAHACLPFVLLTLLAIAATPLVRATEVSESRVVVLNLSSQGFTGGVAMPAGEYLETTPVLPASAPSSTTKPKGQRIAAPPALVLAPWEFRVFSKVTP